MPSLVHRPRATVSPSPHMGRGAASEASGVRAAPDRSRAFVLTRAYNGCMSGDILIGTASWTDPSLIESGRFYPPEAKTAEERLRYYADVFPLVEVDSTYYG